MWPGTAEHRHDLPQRINYAKATFTDKLHAKDFNLNSPQYLDSRFESNTRCYDSMFPIFWKSLAPGVKIR